MPTVRCPSCHRALNLPEFTDIESARCPLCQHTFPVPGRAAPAEPAPLQPWSAPARVDTDNGQPWRTPDQVDTDSTGPMPLGPDEEALPAEDRRAVASASAWLKGSGILGLVHLFFCGCVSFAFIREDAAILLYCGSYIFQLMASLIIYNGGNALRRGTSRGWTETAGILALIMGVLATVMAVPIFLAALREMDLPRRRSTEDTLMLLVALMLNLSLIVAFFVAGVKTWVALRRPSVRTSFER
jgi:hypothetical protein